MSPMSILTQSNTLHIPLPDGVANMYAALSAVAWAETEPEESTQ